MFVNTFSIIDFIRKFHDEEACETALTEARWPSGPLCTKCGCSRVYRLRIRRAFQCSPWFTVFEPSTSDGRDHHRTPQDFTHQVVSSALLSEFAYTEHFSDEPWKTPGNFPTISDLPAP